MAINKDSADTYFQAGNHTDSDLWEAFDDLQREASIVEARRRIISSIARIDSNPRTNSTPHQQTDLLDEDTTTDTDGLPRHDLAVYEQALHILLHSDAVANGQKTGPKWVAKRIADMRKKGVSSHAIAEKAAYFMGWQPGRIFSIRG